MTQQQLGLRQQLFVSSRSMYMREVFCLAFSWWCLDLLQDAEQKTLSGESGHCAYDGVVAGPWECVC